MRADAYWLTNIRLSYSTERFTGTLWGRNGGDEGYPTAIFDLAALGFNQWIPADPLTYGVLLRWRIR